MHPVKQGDRTKLEIPNMEKLTNQKLFVIQKKLTFDSYRYLPL